MKTISKSNFIYYKTCPKSLWLLLNKKEEYVEDESASKHIKEGIEVGNLAKQYFNGTFDTTSYSEDGTLDFKNMIGLTNRCLLEGKETIAEACFLEEHLFCSVDLLHMVDGGYEIYEVKATTKIENEHLIDSAFQKYVLQKRGLNITKTYILHLNKDYRRKGGLDLKQLFVKEQVDFEPLFLETLANIKRDTENIQQLIVNKEEPAAILLSRCKKCPFMKYCHKDIPSPCVLDINGLRGYDLINRGILTYQDLILNKVRLNKRQKIQIDAFLNNKTKIYDKNGIKAFLETIRYPVYHLDFESYQVPIPPSDDTWPYEQIPTQYSLHIEYRDGTLEHKEFLGDSIDPRREIAESLCNNIPKNSCVTAYNKAFECGRLNELAELYPDLREHLENISENVVDLIVPFKSGFFYHKNMGGSNSIKVVLPALYPSDPELNYHALPVVHNGEEAMDIYPKMIVAPSKEKDRIRNGLLKYCCLDTLAMVKILNKLKSIL